MAGKTRKKLLAEIKSLNKELVGALKRNEGLHKQAKRGRADWNRYNRQKESLESSIEQQNKTIAEMEEEISQKNLIIAEYRATVWGQSNILSRALFPKVQESMGGGE